MEELWSYSCVILYCRTPIIPSTATLLTNHPIPPMASTLLISNDQQFPRPPPPGSRLRFFCRHTSYTSSIGALPLPTQAKPFKPFLFPLREPEYKNLRQTPSHIHHNSGHDIIINSIISIILHPLLDRPIADCG